MNLEKSQYEFSAEKNQSLIQERGISFEDIISAIDNGKLLNIVSHYNELKYSHQKIYIVDLNGYVYLIPFVRKNNETVFLKTIFPSQKLSKLYLTQEVKK